MTRRQIRRDLLIALEETHSLQVKGKNRIITNNELIILGQVRKAVNGDTGAARFLFDLRTKLTDEHMELHPDVMEVLEHAEKKFTQDDSERLNKHSMEVFNMGRKRTMKV